LFTDANGVEGSATATVSLPQDVLLYVPAPSIMPFTVRAVVSIVAPEATFNAENNTFTASLCVTVILKVSMANLRTASMEIQSGQEKCSRQSIELRFCKKDYAADIFLKISVM